MPLRSPARTAQLNGAAVEAGSGSHGDGGGRRGWATRQDASDKAGDEAGDETSTAGNDSGDEAELASLTKRVEDAGRPSDGRCWKTQR